MKKQICSWCGAMLLGAVASGMLVKRVWLAKYRIQKEKLALAEQECGQLRTWLELEKNGQHCTAYFETHHLQTVAIFGMNWEGRLLADLLGEKAVYGVELDNFSAVHERMTVYRLGDDPLPPADCMVICDLERLPEKIEIAEGAFSGEIITLSEVLEWEKEQTAKQPNTPA